jgi:hypothetical protein
MNQPTRETFEKRLKTGVRLQRHEHQFTIPVEWKYDSDENIGGDYAPAVIVLTGKRVTKLRCVCGEETER